MKELTVHIDLEHDFFSDSYEQELSEFLIDSNGELIELPELFE